MLKDNRSVDLEPSGQIVDGEAAAIAGSEFCHLGS